MSNGQAPPGNASQLPATLIGWLAVALIVGYIVVLGIAFLSLTVPEATWTRALFLMGGLETLAFTAAGYLFGKEVHRERAEKAEEKADTAEKQARQAGEAGRELRGRIEMLAQSRIPETAGSAERSVGPPPGALGELAARAQTLFPD